MNANITEIKKAISILFRPGDVVELRALGVQGRVHAGYFNDFEKMANEAARLSGNADGIYVVLNEINKDLLARSQNRLTVSPKNLTQDKDVIRRRWLPIDIDAKRPAGISSNSIEHEAALIAAQNISNWLQTQGVSSDSIVIGDSGNGGHVLCCIDMPNDTDSENLIKNVLKVIALKFDSDKVSIDPTVYNAARIWKLYGTLACKGDSTTERPHRIAKTQE